MLCSSPVTIDRNTSLPRNVDLANDGRNSDDAAAPVTIDRSTSLPSNVDLVNDGRNSDDDAAALMDETRRSKSLPRMKLSSYGGRLTAEAQRDLWNNNRAM
eukprot:546705-Prorocentrum_minimum.AAC.1